MAQTIAWIDNSEGEHRGMELNLEQILLRLGGQATEEDALLFAKLWNVRFLDSGSPTFYDQEDFDATWNEILPWLG